MHQHAAVDIRERWSVAELDGGTNTCWASVAIPSSEIHGCSPNADQDFSVVVQTTRVIRQRTARQVTDSSSSSPGVTPASAFIFGAGNMTDAIHLKRINRLILPAFKMK